MIGALEGRIRAMVGRAILRLVDDARQVQEVQLDLLEGESQDAVERFQNYGFAAHPHPGAEVLALSPAGLRSHLIAIVVEDRRYRLKNLAQGEVALFDDLGNVIKLGRDRIVIVAASAAEITAPGGLTINADVTINGNADLTGTLTAASDAVGGGISLKNHTHGGVTAGAAQTEPPA